MSSKSIIKHLVIGGGGPNGLITYGALSHLSKLGFWEISNIESIYGCSIGSLIGIVISLGYPCEWIDDYLIKRPWDKLMKDSKIPISDIISRRGLITDNFIIEFMTPLLKAKELSCTITLKELYEYNHIDIHMFTVDVNSIRLEKIDVSYKTHPDLILTTALAMTMALSIIFPPILMNTECYIDGGMINNFPLSDCINFTKCDLNEILSIRITYTNYVINTITESTSLIEMLYIIMQKMAYNISESENQPTIKNIVECNIEDAFNIEVWLMSITSEQKRNDMLLHGYEFARLFLAKRDLEH